MSVKASLDADPSHASGSNTLSMRGKPETDGTALIFSVTARQNEASVQPSIKLSTCTFAGLNIGVSAIYFFGLVQAWASESKREKLNKRPAPQARSLFLKR